MFHSSEAALAATEGALHTGSHKAYTDWTKEILTGIDDERILKVERGLLSEAASYDWAADEVKKLQVYTVSNLTPIAGKQGVLPANFVLNNADPKISGMSQAQIYEAFYASHDNYDVIKEKTVFKNGLDIAGHPEYQKLLNIGFGATDADASGLSLALSKYKLAKDLNLPDIDGVNGFGYFAGQARQDCWQGVAGKARCD